MNSASIIAILRGNLALIVMTCLVMSSAISVIYLKHLTRTEFVALHKLEQKRDALNEEWGRLLLEQSTWATPGRIEQQAHKRLNMIVPTNDMIMVLKE